MLELKIDPEFEDLFDPKTADEIKNLEQVMIAYGGAYESIKIWNNNGDLTILDGHNRWHIIQKHPEFTFNVQEIKTVHNRLEAKIWILENALVSKTLSSVKKIEIAEELRPLYEEKAKARQGLRTDLNIVLPGEQSESGRVIEKLANIAGVGKETVHRYEVVMKEGSPEQIAAMKSGKKAIKTVYNEVRPKKPKPQQIQQEQENQEEEEVDTRAKGIHLPESKKIEIAFYRKQNPEASIFMIAKHCEVNIDTAKRWMNYPIPEGYQPVKNETEFLGFKNSKLDVEKQKEIVDYCKKHELETTKDIAEKFCVACDTVARLRDKIGQVDPSTRSLNNRIDKMLAESAIYSVDEIKPNEYTEEDALDEMRVMRDEFLNKFERFLEIRRPIVGGKKETIQFIKSFEKDVIARLVDNAKKKGA